jgi:hypothetical protein
MTPAELKAALTAIGWSGRELSIRADCHRNLPVRWLHGSIPVPLSIAAWLNRLARFHEQHPAPEWRTIQR